MQTFSERLRVARGLVRGLGSRELDRLAGLTEGHTSAIETGARPNVEARTAAALARVLGISLDWLVTGDGASPSEDRVQAAVTSSRSDYANAKPKSAA